MVRNEIMLQNLQNKIVSLTTIQTNIQTNATAQIANLENMKIRIQGEITKLQTPEVVNTNPTPPQS